MAGDKSQKTEKATPRRIKEARREGQVVRSPDLVGWIMVLVATFVLPVYVTRAGTVLSERLATLRSVAADPGTNAAGAAARGALDDVFTLLLPVLLGAAVIAVVVGVAQTGPVLSPKALKPQFKRLNPVAGLKRLVSARGQWEAAKAALRLGAVMVVAVPLVLGVGRDLAGRPQFELGHALPYLGGRLLQLARTVALLGLIITAADYGMQRRNHARDLRMTKDDVKQENKQAEGDPLIKRRVRSIQQAMSRNRMLTAVADASVIVVNPTHYSVALSYDPMLGVPVVVAKGAGAAALRIRAEGLAASVPVVECRPLARALYRACDVGVAVPRELFQGVAILLAFVYRLGRRRSYGGVHELDADLDLLGLADHSDRAGRPRERRDDRPTLALTADGPTAS